MESLAEKLEKADDDPRRDYVASLLLPTDDLDRGDRIIETMCSVPPSIAAAILRGLSGMGRRRPRSSAATCPCSCCSRRSEAATTRLACFALRPDVHIGVTVGAGHFHQLDAHEQVTAMIERFVRIAA